MDGKDGLGLAPNHIKLDKFIYKPISPSLNLDQSEKKYLQNKKEIKVCIDPDWMPFEEFDKDGNYQGMSADYFKIFKDKYNLPLKIVKTDTWSQSLEYAQNRKCDLLSLAMETPSRKKYMVTIQQPTISGT